MQNKKLFKKLERAFNKIDPMGIFYGKNTDEYHSEVSILISRKEMIKTLPDLEKELNLIFKTQFEGVEINQVSILSLAKEVSITLKI